MGLNTTERKEFVERGRQGPHIERADQAQDIAKTVNSIRDRAVKLRRIADTLEKKGRSEEAAYITGESRLCERYAQQTEDELQKLFELANEAKENSALRGRIGMMRASAFRTLVSMEQSLALLILELSDAASDIVSAIDSASRGKSRKTSKS